MGPQLRAELIYDNLSARSGNGEVAQLALCDNVHGLRWCSGLKNRMRTFLAAPTCSLSDPIAPGDGKRSSLMVA
jgi:hypothetical protein